jgi:hypothetical protein
MFTTKCLPIRKTENNLAEKARMNIEERMMILNELKINSRISINSIITSFYLSFPFILTLSDQFGKAACLKFLTESVLVIAF